MSRRLYLILFFSFVSLHALAQDLWELNSHQGHDWSLVSVQGSALSLERGVGKTFTPAFDKKYKELYDQSMNDSDFPVQWQIRDLEKGEILGQSIGVEKIFYGASIIKIFTAGALLKSMTESGSLPAPSDVRFAKLAAMISVSDNNPWQEFDRLLGLEQLQNFTTSLGLKATRAWRSIDNRPVGNRINVKETAEFIQFLFNSTKKASPDWAELTFRLMLGTRSGKEKGRAYISSDFFTGGKTGSYAGLVPKLSYPGGNYATISLKDQEKVQVQHHVLLVHRPNHAKPYLALILLSNRGLDSDCAFLAKGLMGRFVP